MRFISFLFIILAIGLSNLTAQCDVFIEPSSVVVTDNGSGVNFTFDITNNSPDLWYGDVVKLNWTLNSSAPIWDIDYSSNTNSLPLSPGETRTVKTPWFDIPNLPSWFPDDPNASQPWEESMEWAYYGLPFPFEGAWSPMRLRLGSCGLADAATIYDNNGDLYYGPFNSDCPDLNNDAFCDCDLDFIGFDPNTLDVSVEVISHWNCGTTLNSGFSGEVDAVNHIHFGLHVPGWDYQWGCTTGNIHPGWTFAGWSSIGISNNELFAGEILNINLLDLGPDAPCFQELLSSDTLTACTEIVLWQINYSQTLNITDDGWAVNEGGDDTQEYPDNFIDLNSLNVCEAPPPLYPGCMDEDATNYDVDAGYDDGTCLYGPVLGCTDPIACNYDSSATSNDGSCDYSCIGCMDENASNYNPDAIYDNNNCEYFFPDADPNVSFFGNECVGEEYDPTYGVFVYNYGEDTLYQYCVEILELGVDTCLDGNVFGASWIEPNAAQFIGYYTIPDSITQFTVTVYNVSDEYFADDINNIQVVNVNQPNDNPCEIIDQLILDILPDEIWSYGGTCTDPFFNQNFLIENVGQGVIDSLTFNFNVTTWDGDLVLEVEQDYYATLQPGDILNIDDLPDVFTGDLNLVTVTVSWIDENGELQTDTQTFDILLYCWGCTDPEATNYINSPYVFDAIPDHWLVEFPNTTPPTPDQIECEYDELELTYIDINPIYECSEFEWEGGYYIPEIAYENTGDITITEFCASYNIFGSLYDEEICWNGILEPGQIVYLQFPPVFADGMGGVYIQVNDINGLGGGWTEIETGIEYASIADELCIYGCTDPTADNYNPAANMDDGNCTFLGCTDPAADNYDPTANVDDGSCVYYIYGCTDSAAINYNSDANVDDGSCIYNIYGCTDSSAINYNPIASIDDGSCIYDPCDGMLGAVYFAPNTFTPNNDGVNDGWAVVTDPQCWLRWNVYIFNRWGQLVWESTTPGEVWPGSMFNGGYYVADGIYFYKVKGIGYNPANTFETTGHITVFR
jgi:gliding motility-associated-like protein